MAPAAQGAITVPRADPLGAAVNDREGTAGMPPTSQDDPLVDAMRRKGGASEQRLRAEEELRFRVEARRDRLLAEWAAERMGLAPADVAAHVERLIAADLAAPGPDDVVAKVLGDLRGRGVEVEERELRARLSAFEQEAWRELASGA